MRSCWGRGQEPHHEGWGSTTRAGSRNLKEQKCPDLNPRRVRPRKPVPGGDARGWHAGVGWHRRGPAGLLKNHANTSVKRLKDRRTSPTGTWASWGTRRFGKGMCQFSPGVDLRESAKPFLNLSQYRLKPKLLLTSSNLI